MRALTAGSLGDAAYNAESIPAFSHVRERGWMPANGLALSRRLEGTTLLDREAFFLPLDAKIATIQPVGSRAVLGRGSIYAPHEQLCIQWLSVSSDPMGQTHA